MRAAFVSTVGASVSFFVPAVDLRPAVRPGLQPAVQTAVQPVLEPALQPALRFAPSFGSEPAAVALPSARPAGNADDSLRWFSYGFVAALGVAAAGSRLKSERTERIARRTTAARMQLPPTEPPPEGFVWAEDSQAVAESASAKEVTTSPAASTEGVVKPIAASAATAVPKAEEAPKAKATKAKATKAKAPKKVLWKEGIFAPLVLGAKKVMGEQQLKELRAKVITKHSKVIADFVDTSSSPFGQLVVQRMFEYADKDGNGTLDKEEVKAALKDLGFDFYSEKQVKQIMDNADADKNDVIDFEEFVKATPKTLRTSLVKLAKKNGHDLGFLV